MSEVRKYRKRPVVIEAMQWDGSAEGATPIIDWVLSGGGTARYHCVTMCGGVPQAHVIRIVTLEGEMDAVPRDYVIRGIKGEFYPCKPDIFEASYEPEVDERPLLEQMGEDPHYVWAWDKEAQEWVRAAKVL